MTTVNNIPIEVIGKILKYTDTNDIIYVIPRQNMLKSTKMKIYAYSNKRLVCKDFLKADRYNGNEFWTDDFEIFRKAIKQNKENIKNLRVALYQLYGYTSELTDIVLQINSKELLTSFSNLILSCSLMLCYNQRNLTNKIVGDEISSDLLFLLFDE